MSVVEPVELSAQTKGIKQHSNGGVERTCLVCGKQYKTWLAEIRKGGGKYCSQECYHKIAGNSLRKRITITCSVCGKTFDAKPSEVKNGNGKYCSRKCMGIGKKKKVGCVCQACGKRFEAYPSEIKKGGGKYCSRKCAGTAPGAVEVTCIVCGKTFKTLPSRIKKGYSKFCSYECYLTANKREVKRFCEECGKEIVTTPYAISIKRGRFCSKECLGAWHAKTLVGKNASNWKGGVSFEPYCEKFTDEFRERVRDFFGRRCFMCGKTEEENGEALSVHHVNYEKKACCKGEEVTQDRLFVPLCRKHHSQTGGGDREAWKLFFMYGIALHTNGTMKTYYHKDELY